LDDEPQEAREREDEPGLEGVEVETSLDEQCEATDERGEREREEEERDEALTRERSVLEIGEQRITSTRRRWRDGLPIRKQRRREHDARRGESGRDIERRRHAEVACHDARETRADHEADAKRDAEESEGLRPVFGLGRVADVRLRDGEIAGRRAVDHAAE